MAGASGEGEGKASRGIYPAEQNVGDGVSGLFTGIPLHEYGGEVVLLPLDGKRFACYQYENDGGTRVVYRTDELGLGSGEVQIVEVEALAAGRIFVTVAYESRTGAAAEDDGDLALTGSFYGFGNARCIERSQATSFGVAHGGVFTYPAFDTLQRSDAVFVVAAPGVIAKLYLVGIGADDGNRLQAFGVEGQQVVFVFQQYGRFVGDGLRQPYALGSVAFVLFVSVAVGVVKQARGKLGIQDPAYSRVDDRFVDDPFFDKTFQEGVAVARGFDIESGGNGLDSGFGRVAGRAVHAFEHFDGTPVGVDIPFESPLIAQNFGEHIVRSRIGHVVPRVVARHYGQYPRVLYHHFERLEINLVQVSQSAFHRRQIQTAQRVAVRPVVFEHGRYAAFEVSVHLFDSE